MKVTTRESLAATAAREWQLYGYDPTIGKQLVGVTDPDQVDLIVGNSTWTEIICQECMKNKPTVLFSNGTFTTQLCRECLEEGAKLL